MVPGAFAEASIPTGRAIDARCAGHDDNAAVGGRNGGRMKRATIAGGALVPGARKGGRANAAGVRIPG
jgi:hypothetical protein